jgi:hypothetical protein
LSWTASCTGPDPLHPPAGRCDVQHLCASPRRRASSAGDWLMLDTESLIGRLQRPARQCALAT